MKLWFIAIILWLAIHKSNAQSLVIYRYNCVLMNVITYKQSYVSTVNSRDCQGNYGFPKI